MAALNKFYLTLLLSIHAILGLSQNKATSLEWLSPTLPYLEIQTSEISIEIKINGVAKPDMQKFTLLVNGINVTPTIANEGSNKFTTVPLQKEASFIYKTTLTLHEGEQEVVFIYDNVRSSAKRFRYVRNVDKPNLYVLAMGPATNLHYTVKDACDFANAFKNQAGNGGIYGEVFIKTILGADATVAKMTEGIEVYSYKYDLEKMNKPIPNTKAFKPSDVIILFISSHGFRRSGDYYIVGSNTDVSLERSASLRLRDMLDLLDPIPCKKILFIDACQKATDISPGLVGGLDKEISNYKNLAVFTSSSENEISVECVNVKQGAFTKGILDGLKGAADKIDANKGDIDISELFSFLYSYVPPLAANCGGRQTPKLVHNTLGAFSFYIPLLFPKNESGCNTTFNPGTENLIGIQITDGNSADDISTKKFVDAIKDKGYRADFGDIKIKYKFFSNFISGKLVIAKTKIEETNYKKTKKSWVSLDLDFYDKTLKQCTSRNFQAIVNTNTEVSDETIKQRALNDILEQIKNESELPLCN